MPEVPLTPAWTQLRPHRLQSKLWRTTARFTVVVAGRGSGKTEVSRRKLVRFLDVLKPWQDRNYVYGLPTYSQAKRVAWDQLNALIPNSWVSDKNSGRNKSELCITTNAGAKLYVVGLDKPQRIEGIQLDGAVIDECSDQHPSTYTKSILPMLTHRNAWCSRIGVPKRNGVGAAEFKAAFEEGLIPGNAAGIESYTWSSDTILTPDQLVDVLKQLTAKDAEEQLGGLWVAGEGQIFYAYSEADTISESAQYDPNNIIGVGSDFNVNPMAWVLFHVRDGKMYVFDELFIRNTNTQSTLDILHSRYMHHKAGWMFFGDASAQNRHSSTAITDYIQIKNDKRFDTDGRPKQIHYPTKNPAVADRLAATNALLLNGMGIRRLFINKKCTNLRNDLATRSYKEGTREIDDSASDSGHITDALGYPVYKLFPLRSFAPQGQISVTGQSSTPTSTVVSTVYI